MDHSDGNSSIGGCSGKAPMIVVEEFLRVQTEFFYLSNSRQSGPCERSLPPGEQIAVTIDRMVQFEVRDILRVGLIPRSTRESFAQHLTAFEYLELGAAILTTLAQVLHDCLDTGDTAAGRFLYRSPSTAHGIHELATARCAIAGVGKAGRVN